MRRVLSRFPFQEEKIDIWEEVATCAVFWASHCAPSPRLALTHTGAAFVILQEPLFEFSLDPARWYSGPLWHSVVFALVTKAKQSKDLKILLSTLKNAEIPPKLGFGRCQMFGRWASRIQASFPTVTWGPTDL